MLGVKVPKKEAEWFRKHYRELILTEYKPKKEDNFIIFPVKEAVKNYKTIETKFEVRPKKPKSVFEDTNAEIQSFDIIGDVLILQLKGSEDVSKLIENMRKLHPNIKTICTRAGTIEDEFRTLPIKILWGNGTETVHTEYGIKIKLDISKVYFTPRLAEERKRIADMVKSGEKVAVFFAGVGPYALMIARSKNVEIWAIEKNPYAYEYLCENIELNKLKGKIYPFLGDVKEIVPKLDVKFDRIIMPLPRKAHEFLYLIPRCSHRGTVVHYYRIAEQPELVIKELKEKLLNIKILGWRKTGSVSPKEKRWVVDFEVIE